MVCLSVLFTLELVKSLKNYPVIPISEHQDTVGPICRSLTDAAAVLSVIAGPDPNDNFTLAQPLPVPNFSLAVKNTNALRGARIGVPRKVFTNDTITGNDPFVNVVFEQAIQTIRGLGATVVDPADLPTAEQIAVSNNETIVLDIDFKVGSPHMRLERTLCLNPKIHLDPIKQVFRKPSRQSQWRTKPC